ncbi:beta-lactamase, partial [Metarhizium brunneum ARSEF 3297]
MVSNLTHFTETRNLGRRSYNRTVPVEPGGITIVANRGTITRAILGEKLVYKTGTKYLYPDLNFMTLMLAVEKVTGKKLDDNIYENTSLLRMHSSTFFNRGNVEGPEFKYYKANSRAGAPDFGREKRPRAPTAAVACAWNRPRRECLGAGRRLGPRRTLLHSL